MEKMIELYRIPVLNEDENACVFVSQRYGKYVAYCPKCGKAVEPKRIPGYRVGTCDCSCGYKFIVENLYDYTCHLPEEWGKEHGYEQNPVTSFSKMNIAENHDVRIYEKDTETGKQLTLFMPYTTVLPGKTCIIKRPLYAKIIVNVGKQSYFFNKGTKAFANLTFGSNITNTIYAYKYTEAYNIFAKEILRHCNIPENAIKELEERVKAVFTKRKLIGEEEFLKFAIRANRCPNLVFRKINGIVSVIPSLEKEIKDSFRTNIKLVSDKYKSNLPNQLMESSEFINMMINKLKIPASKRFKKLYIENQEMMGFMKWLKECKIKSPDILYAWRKYYINIRYFGVKHFIKAMVKIKGEINTTKCFMDFVSGENFMSKQMYVKDGIYMYENFLKAKDDEIRSIFTDERIFRNNNLKEIHDVLSRIQARLQYKNVELQYNDTEKNLEETIDVNGDKYEFRLFENTNKMIDVGEQLQICVGSAYRDAAIKKSSTLLYVLKDNKYCACVETCKSTKESFNLIQLKGYRNTILNGDVAKAAKEWCQKTNLHTENCNDYQRIGKSESTEFVYGNVAFNRVNLADIENDNWIDTAIAF